MKSLVTALSAGFVLLTGGAAVALAGTAFYRADAVPVVAGAIWLVFSALTWVNTQSKERRG